MNPNECYHSTDSISQPTDSLTLLDAESRHPIKNPEALYVHLLLAQRRGLPQYRHTLNSQLPTEKIQRGICIGDVGYIDHNGHFAFMFNVYLPPEHPVHRGLRLPVDFSPLKAPENSDLSLHAYPPMSYVAVGAVSMHPRGSDAENSLSFRSTSTAGAICVLPRGSEATRLESIESLRTYAAHHASKWYELLPKNSHQAGFNGSLCVVTGVENTDAWGTAVFRQIYREGCCIHFVEEEDIDGNPSYSWIYSPVTAKCDSVYPANEEARGRRNQTMFLHGFQIGLGQKPWSTLPQSASRRNNSRVGRLFARLPAWLVSWIWSWPRWFANEYFAFYPLEYFLPSQITIEYLSAKVPSANLVIAHDELLSVSGEEMLNPEEAVSRIERQYEVRNDQGTAYLVPRQRRWYQLWA